MVEEAEADIERQFHVTSVNLALVWCGTPSGRASRPKYHTNFMLFWMLDFF